MTSLAVPLALAASLGSLSPHAAPPRPASRAAVTGQLVFLERGRFVPLAEVKWMLEGRPVGLALRSGWDVAQARMEPDGRFIAVVEPGTWRIEWIELGDHAEVLATPLEAEARDGRTTCVGRITLAFDDVKSQLGSNVAGSVTVEDRCGEIAAMGGTATGDVSLARPGPDQAGGVGSPGWMDVLAGIRVAALTEGDAGGLRLSWAIPFRRPLEESGNVLVSAAAVRLLDDGSARHDAIELGVGYTPLGGIELAGGVQLGGARGAAPWTSLRWGSGSYALEVRVLPEPGGVVWSFALDVCPLYLVGSWL